MDLPVVEVRCRYKHPARYDDEITIRTWLAQMRTSLLRFQYEVVRKSDGRLLAEGESVHVVVGRDMKRTHLTEKYRDALCTTAASRTVVRRSQARKRMQFKRGIDGCTALEWKRSGAGKL